MKFWLFNFFLTFFYRKWAISVDFGSFRARRTQLWTVRKNEPLGVRRWVSPFWNQNKQNFLLTKGGMNLYENASLVENTPMLQVHLWLPWTKCLLLRIPIRLRDGTFRFWKYHHSTFRSISTDILNINHIEIKLIYFWKVKRDKLLT